MSSSFRHTGYLFCLVIRPLAPPPSSGGLAGTQCQPSVMATPRTPPYSLRCHGNTRTHGVAELIPARPGTSREGTEGSSPLAQTTFLQMMGLVQSSEDLWEPVLTFPDAEILSSAVNHEYYGELKSGSDDKYFTPHMYRQVVSSMTQTLEHLPQLEAARLSDNMDVSNEISDNMIQEYNQIHPIECNCAAHKAFRESSDDFFTDAIGRLVSTPSTINDHYGGELAEALLPLIFQKADIPATVRKCGLGAPTTVNFILELPSNHVFHFTGRPHYTVNDKFRTIINRFTVKGIGEVQSPPGRRRESKDAALSQAGIYVVGQLCKDGAPSSLPAVVLYKDKTAQVAIATIEHSIGKVQLQLLHQMEPINLKTPEGMILFASLLVGTMKKTNYN